MRFSVLGPLEVVYDGRQVAFGGVTQRAFLAFLLLNVNRTVSVTQAVDALWGDAPPPSAKNMLHNAVWGVRKALKELDPSGEVVSVLSQKPGYLLRVPEECVDLHQFKALVTEGRSAAASGDPGAAAEVFRRALALWRGQALADLADTGITWPALGALEEARLTTWEDCFEAELACGRHREVISELSALVEAEPLRERLCGQLMLALYRAGRQAEALSVYRRARAVFVAELGIEPGPGLRQLEQAVLAQDPALAVARTPGFAPARPAESKTSGAWERRRVSTVLLDVRPLGCADQRLAEVLEVVRDVTARFGGVVSGMVGTTVQVLFGAERTLEDDPVRATRAALVLRERFRPAEGGETVAEVRLAVATGDAMVSRDDRPLPPMTIGVSDRGLELLAEVAAYEIAVCETTYRAARAEVEFVAGPGGGWTPVSAEAESAHGEPLPLVERDRETGLLAQLLEDIVRGGRPHLVTLLGEAGLGKSRLVAELAGIAEAHPMRVRTIEPRTRDIGDGAAYCSLFEIVKAFAGIQATDPSAIVEEKLGRAVREAVSDPDRVGWVETSLRALAGLGRPAAVPAEEIWRAARVFLEEAAATGPLLLVLEALHAADDQMLDFVDELTGQLGPVPLLLVATARPDLLRRRPGWSGGKRSATTISLTPLSDAGTALLLRMLFERYGLSEKDVEADAEFWPDLVARIGGNPRFAGEYVRMLAETPGSGLGLPESVQAVLGARLDTLAETDRAVLMDASVLGTVVWPGAVAAVSGRPLDEVRRSLETLARREILTRARRSSVAGEPEYVFGQVLTREIAYERLPLAARAKRHRLAASWIERLPVDHAESLAHHYGSAVSLAAATGQPTAELSGRARAVLAETGRRAEGLGALRAAVRCYRAALDLCPAHDRARPELLLRYGKALAATGGGEDVLGEAREALLVSGDIVGAATAEFHLALLADRREGEVGSRPRREHAMDLVADAEGAAAAGLRCALAMTMVIDGHCAQARELADRALAAADRLERPDLQVDALKARGAARVDLGDLDGISDLRRAVRICARYGRPTTRALGNLSCGLARAGQLGDLPGVRAEAELSARKYADVVAGRMLRGTAVVEHYWAGDWGQALEQAARLLAEFGPDWLPLRASWHMVRGRNALYTGDAAAAEVEAGLSLGVARRLNDPQDLCPALAFSARVALAAGRKEEARAFVDELLKLLSGRTLLPDIGVDLPIVLADLGYAAGALDDVRPSPWREAAMAFVAGDPAEAAELYRQIGSRPDEEQARRCWGRVS